MCVREHARVCIRMCVLLLFIIIIINDKGCTEGWACKRAPHKYKVITVRILGLHTDTKATKTVATM